MIEPDATTDAPIPGDAGDPPLPGGAVVALWNAPLPREARRQLLARAVGSYLPRERARERDHFLVRAAALASNGLTINALARALRARMVILAGVLPETLNTSTQDGCLCAALIIAGKVPSHSSIWRALVGH